MKPLVDDLRVTVVAETAMSLDDGIPVEGKWRVEVVFVGDGHPPGDLAVGNVAEAGAHGGHGQGADRLLVAPVVSVDSQQGCPG